MMTPIAAGPLAGLRVVELGVWVAGPSAGGILADWGADVTKIEPVGGDPFRGFFRAVAGFDMPSNPPFELDNRGKRSVALDVGTADGAAIVRRLVAQADVVVTNLRPIVLERAGLDAETLTAANPRLVYGRITGYGDDGPDRDRPAYDVGAFWARAGIAASLTHPGGEPPYQRGGLGDHTTGMALASGIVAALYARERTGRGQIVSTSLFRAGIYTLGFDLNTTLRFGTPAQVVTRRTMPNPLVCPYRDRDGRWFWLLGLQGDRHWPDLVRAVDRPGWLDDPRFRDFATRVAHCGELVDELDALFATAPLAVWGERFDRAGMWWAPVQTTDQVVADPQAAAAGAWVDVPSASGDEAVKMVATPVDFSVDRWAPRGASPEAGQHTEAVLLELGLDWAAIGDLKARGVIP